MTPPTPPPLTKEDIERKYAGLFEDVTLARGSAGQALEFVRRVAEGVSPEQGDALLGNFHRFLETGPSEKEIWASLLPLSKSLVEAGKGDILVRHRERVAAGPFKDFLSKVAGGKGPAIVFVADKPYFTIVREALYLRRNGYRVFLASLARIPENLRAMFENAFEATVDTLNSPEQMGKLIDRLNPEIFHVQCRRWSYWLGKLVIERKRKAKVVCEFYDITSLIAPRAAFCRVWEASEVDFDFAMEKEICLGSDAVVTRFPKAMHGKLRERWGGPEKLLRFWPYPCPEFTHYSQRKHSEDGEGIRVVFAGNIIPRNQAHPKGMFPQRGLLDVCENLLGQGMHVDLLQDPYMPVDLGLPGFEDYARLAGAFPRFGVMSGEAPDNLSQRLAPYDFALMAFRFDLDQSWRYPEGIKYGIGTRLFNYMEAGLPIIISAESGYMADLVEKNHLGIVVPWDEMGRVSEKIKAFDYPRAVENIRRYNDEFGMDKQIVHLIDLYTSLG